MSAAASLVEVGACVKLNDVVKRYDTSDGEVLALGPVSFDLRRGEFLSVVGPSGCGKSTLLTLLSGLAEPTEGSVAVDGRELRGPNRECGIAFQSPVLLEWRTALDNVLLQFEMRGMDRETYRQQAIDLLRSLGLEGAERRYPRELSGGMRQRVSIARALIHDPPLLLLDEPFSAVDALTRDQLVADLQRVWLEHDDLTVLFITHHIEEAVFLGDRVLVMTPRPGRISELIDIDIPRPRRIHDRDLKGHGDYSRRIRDLFVQSGVFREGAR
ncbi:MAG: ABC transporter ATP-binding protein [Solirubrobacteraceae bacterium]|nr:ABC transporter ATP-binding protein [Solirubrobacteraceae bacterium]